MTRYLAIALTAALAGFSVWFSVPDSAEPGALAAENPPSVAVCGVLEGSGRQTTIGIVSTVNGVGRLTAFAGGRAAGSALIETGASASDSIDIVDVAAVGVAAALIELPVPDSAAGSIVSGAQSLSADTCATEPHPQALIAGGSTLSGDGFELQLMNPYAGEATVDLSIVSEAGTESSEDLTGVVVPSRSSVILDLAELLPGRERMSIVAETLRGSVITIGRFTRDGDSAVWNAVPAAQDWFVPLPASGDLVDIVISAASPVPTDYQVDLYGPDGLFEAFQEGAIPPQDQIVIDLAGVEFEVTGVRVVSAAPVATFLRAVDANGVALSTGSTLTATQWLLPGAGSSSEALTRVAVLNPSTEDATVVVTERRRSSTATQVMIPSDSVRVLELEGLPRDGVAVDSDVPIVVSWSSTREFSAAFAVGLPLADG